VENNDHGRFEALGRQHSKKKLVHALGDVTAKQSKIEDREGHLHRNKAPHVRQLRDELELQGWGSVRRSSKATILLAFRNWRRSSPETSSTGIPKPKLVTAEISPTIPRKACPRHWTNWLIHSCKAKRSGTGIVSDVGSPDWIEQNTRS
jgi:hypothetical protein